MNFKLLVLMLICCSCSTLKKTKTYSATAGVILGGLVGGVVGEQLSPNDESDNFNKNLGMALGSVIGGYGAYKMGSSFYQDDPENFKGEPIEIKYKNQKPKTPYIPVENSLGIKLGDLGINMAPSSKEVYANKVTADLPAQYQNDVMKQVVIKHKIPQRKIKDKSGRTLIIKETEVLEHRYVD